MMRPTFARAATRFGLIETAISGATALVDQPLFFFDRAQDDRVLRDTAHTPIYEDFFGSA